MPSVTAVRTAVLRQDYADGSRNTRHAWSGKNYVLLVVEAGDAFGLGEIYCDGHGSPAVTALSVEEEIAPVVVGRDARDVGAIRQDLLERTVLAGRGSGFGPVLSGLDMALWDLAARRLGEPLRRLLGGVSDRAAVYGSGGMYGPAITPESLAADMAAAVASGLGGVKIKAGGATLTEDVARATAVREAIGPDARLMVDAMFAPTVPEAVRLAEALRPLGLHFLEAPTAAADRAGWALVRTRGGIPLAGPELEPDADVNRAFLTEGLVHFLQFDLAICGGLSGGRDLCALARAFHRPVTLHCAASAVGLAAAAHLAAAVPNADSVEFHLKHQGLFERLWSSGFRLEDGHLVVPDRPGLGLDLAPADLVPAARAA